MRAPYRDHMTAPLYGIGQSSDPYLVDVKMCNSHVSCQVIVSVHVRLHCRHVSCQGIAIRRHLLLCIRMYYTHVPCQRANVRERLLCCVSVTHSGVSSQIPTSEAVYSLTPKILLIPVVKSRQWRLSASEDRDALRR